MATYNYDILGQLLSQDDAGNTTTSKLAAKIVATADDKNEEYLKSIDKTLKDILRNGRNMSQSNVINDMPNSEDVRHAARRRHRNASNFTNADVMFSLKELDPKTLARKLDATMGEFLDAFEDEILQSIVGADFQGKINGALKAAADQLGVEVSEIPGMIGKELGKQAAASLKETSIGKKIYGKVDKIKQSTMSWFSKTYEEGAGAPFRAGGASAASTKSGTSASKAAGAGFGGGGSGVRGILKLGAGDGGNLPSVMDKAGTALGPLLEGGTKAGNVLGGLSKIAGKLGPKFLLLQVAATALAPVLKGLKDGLAAMSKAANRDSTSRKKNLAEAQKRLDSDMRSIIEEPFNILKEAAQEVYNAWDKNVRVINATQGYNKEDLQSLMSSYSQRLRDEGLSKYVSGADITDNLARVLESGLSGQVAEEFAYLATKLNAAIPTQDFFGYADEYASIAANAIKNGYSQASAIQYANKQMETFASNVLYASRQLAGGFSTGLKDAEDLFAKSVQIAQAAKTNNADEISGVLTSVAAITGAIAPDLANSLTDAVYRAAVGGNSSEIVALRSLAGVNASNTEFLKLLATDPKKIFTELFSNLAKMQNMSPDSFMEVAEGVSSVFGLSMDAFARVDFNYLARSISNMNVNNASLEENMQNLLSGQTTATAEQLRMQQINEYLIDEGLAYVMDNEVARSIQEHMWDEQLAREIMEAEYGVNLQGAGLDFLESIATTVENIMNLINPIAWIKKGVNLVTSYKEGNNMKADIGQLLELGKVGPGNPLSKYQLTTRNQDLNLAPSLLNMMGGSSAYADTAAWRADANNFMNRFIGVGSGGQAAFKQNLMNTVSQMQKQAERRSATSRYDWNIVGKSFNNALNNVSLSSGAVPSTYAGDSSLISSSISESAQSSANAKLEQMLSGEYMQKFIEEGKSYEDWAASASSFGIQDLSAAFDSAGLTEQQVRGKFQAEEGQAGARIQMERYQKEEQVWDMQLLHMPKVEDLLTTNNDTLVSIIDRMDIFGESWEGFKESWGKFKTDWTKYFSDWTDYFIKHTAYSASYDHTSVAQIQKDEKDESNTAIYALAEALSKNTVDLLDPAVQTNALLSQILLVVKALQVAQATKTNGGTLADTLAGLALGLQK